MNLEIHLPRLLDILLKSTVVLAHPADKPKTKTQPQS